MRFWFRYFDRNQTLVELNNFEHLRKIVTSDYPTFSGLTLENWFKLKMIESHKFSDIGSWWERKSGKDANEIDIVAISVDGRSASLIEVKRQRRNYNHKEFMEKVDVIKNKILGKFRVETKLLTLEDM